MTALEPLAVQNAALLRQLAALDGAAGAPSVSAIARQIGRDESNVRKSIKALAAEGLATADPLGLTEAGRDQLGAIRRAEEGQGEPGSSPDPRWPEQLGDIRMLVHAQILPNPQNDRSDWDSDEAREELDALREDIVQVGLLQNLVVRPAPTGTWSIAKGAQELPTFILIGGERRWRAIGLAIQEDDWPADRPIPCRVIEADDLASRLAALSENLQRRNLNPLEKARAFEGLAVAFIESGIAADRVNREIADRLGVTMEHVQQHRRFLTLDEDDQVRLTLPKDDPRHLSVSGARALAASRSERAQRRAEIESLPIEQRLAAAEILHAVATRGSYSWDSILVRPGFAESEIGQALVAADWFRFAGPLGYGAKLGHYVVSRGYGLPHEVGAPFLTNDAAVRDEALRAVRAEAGEGDRDDYQTEWLNPPFDLDEAGEQVKAEREAEETAEKARQAQRDRDRKAMDERMSLTRVHVEALLAKAATPPAAPVLEDVPNLASQLQHPLPWRATDSGSVVDAEGREVLESPWGVLESAAVSLAMMTVVAVNTAAGLETPPLLTDAEEADQDIDGDDPEADPDEFADDDADEQDAA